MKVCIIYLFSNFVALYMHSFNVSVNVLNSVLNKVSPIHADILSLNNNQ